MDKLFSKNLRKFMNERKMTGEYIGDLMGRSKASIIHWANGRRFPNNEDDIRQLAAILGVTVEDLFAKDPNRVYKIKRIGYVSCGGSIYNADYVAEGSYCLYGEDDWNPELYCLIATGNSMSPEIDDGDEVICDPTAHIQHGDMVHYELNGESAVKVFIDHKSDGIIQLKPYNQTETFKTRTIRIDDEAFENIKMNKVVSVNKRHYNNRAARLRMVGES